MLVPILPVSSTDPTFTFVSMDSRFQNALADMAKAITGSNRRFSQLADQQDRMSQAITDLSQHVRENQANTDRLLQAVEQLAQTDRTVTVTPQVTVAAPVPPTRSNLFIKEPPNLGTTNLGTGHTDFLNSVPEKIKLWNADAFRLLTEAQWTMSLTSPPCFQIDDSKREVNEATFSLLYASCRGRARAHVDNFLRQKHQEFITQPEFDRDHDDYDEQRQRDLYRSAFFLWRCSS